MGEQTMREIELEELKKIQIGVLDYVDAFCKEHEIKYWIDCGTLIGAVRHKGYIPWDDDIDIGMLREEYDRFCEIFNKKANERYRLHNCENDSTFRYGYSKVMDHSTVLYEPDEKGVKEAVNIDVFVYDNAPDNDFLMRWMYFKRDLYRALRSFQYDYTSYGSPVKIALTKVLRKALMPYFKGKPENYCVCKIVKNSKSYAMKKTKRIGDFVGASVMCSDKSNFEEVTEVEFEGKKYPAPVGYDKYLTDYYGNYMQLPPVEKRVSNHHFKAYVTE